MYRRSNITQKDKVYSGTVKTVTLRKKETVKPYDPLNPTQTHTNTKHSHPSVGLVTVRNVKYIMGLVVILKVIVLVHF